MREAPCGLDQSDESFFNSVGISMWTEEAVLFLPALWLSAWGSDSSSAEHSSGEDGLLETSSRMWVQGGEMAELSGLSHWNSLEPG